MIKRGVIGWAAVFSASVLTLCPALPAGQIAAQKQPQKPQIIEMEGFRVSPPPGGKWEIVRDETGGVTFAMSKGKISVTVSPLQLPLIKWRMTETELVDFLLDSYANMRIQGAGAPGKVLAKGETILGDKKLHFVKFEKPNVAAGKTADLVFYFYFPPNFRKFHALFNFLTFFVHPAEDFKAPISPGLDPARAVIDSLEIVDPIQAVPGPNGDLLRAAAAGDVEAARRAIGEGASANAEIPGYTALTAAALFGHREAIDLLLEHGADINKADKIRGHTPLHQAVAGLEPETAAALVEHGANVNLRTDAGYSALIFAVATGQPTLVRMLVEKGANVNAKSDEGEAALFFAADGGSTEIAEFLIANRADLNSQMDDGWTPLMQAVFWSNPEAAKMLLDAGANPNLKGVSGWTALMAAIAPAKSQADSELAGLLMAKGADLNAQLRENGQAPLHLSLFEKEFDIARMLIEAGADVNIKMEGGATPLIVAAGVGQADLLKLLIEKGADLNARDKNSQTALMIAKKNKNAEIIKLLEAAGAK